MLVLLFCISAFVYVGFGQSLALLLTKQQK